jgi:putative transposase
MNSVKTIITLLGDLATFLWLFLRPQSTIAAENPFLRKQLAMFQERKVKPHRPDTPIRITLVLLSRLFNWWDALVVVQPRTLVQWHRQGFRLFWRWKSRPGRPPIPVELRRLIRGMAMSNLSWGEERIRNELLLKLGVAYRHVPYENICPNIHGGISATINAGRTFFRNHVAAILACDVCAARNPRLFAAVALQTENHSILNGSFRTAAPAHGSMRTQA